MANSELPHLPLPGERPSTIYRPEGARARHTRLPLTLFGWAFLLLMAVLASLLVWRLTAATITLNHNSLPQTIHTHRETVAGVLRAAHIDPELILTITPGPDAAVRDGMTIEVVTAAPVLVHTAEGVILIDAAQSDLLAAVVEIALGPDERLVARRLLPSSLASESVIREAAVTPLTRVIVTEGDGRVSFDSPAPTVGEALSEVGYSLYQADRVDPPLWTPLVGGELEITLTRAIPVYLRLGDRMIPVRSVGATVADLLAEQGLAASGLDTVTPSLETVLTAGMTVRLTRVEERSISETETLSYERIYVPDPAMEIDQLRSVRAGESGLIERRYHLRLEDGREVSRVLVGEWAVKEPVPEVVAYGTKIVIRTLQTVEGRIEYWRVLRVLATSYSPLTAGHKQPGDPGFGMAAGGTAVVRGIVAVDPRVINLYQWMYIPGYGMGRALDTGGAVKGLRVDLGYSDADYFERYEWITIYLMTPVPTASEINWMLPDQAVE